MGTRKTIRIIIISIGGFIFLCGFVLIAIGFCGPIPLLQLFAIGAAVFLLIFKALRDVIRGGAK